MQVVDPQFKFSHLKMASKDSLTKYALDIDTLNMIYDWVDQVPLSRPKKNIARDFSDARLLVSPRRPTLSLCLDYGPICLSFTVV
jgi:hypothetical protein